MMPLMAFEITFSIEILKNFLPVFIDKCIRGIDGRTASGARRITSARLPWPRRSIRSSAMQRRRRSPKSRPKTGKRIPDLLREKNLLTEEKIAEIFTPEFLAGQADRKQE